MIKWIERTRNENYITYDMETNTNESYPHYGGVMWVEYTGETSVRIDEDEEEVVFSDFQTEDEAKQFVAEWLLNRRDLMIKRAAEIIYILGD